MTLNISVIQGAKGKRLALREARILSNPSKHTTAALVIKMHKGTKG